MRNPLTDEDAAFRVVLGTIAYVAPIVVASWIATWLGLVTFAVATAVVIWRLRRRPEPLPSSESAGKADVEDTPVDPAARS
jgi:type IV secretory pathway TrbD component